MSKNKAKITTSIPLERSHLYGIHSTHLLAKKLGYPLSDLERLANKAKYRIFNLKVSGRLVQEPPPPLQSLHRKVHRYLSRIEAPDYLHSAVKGRSYISNAKAHIGLGSMIKIDVKRFFPSVPQHRVMHFFRDIMNCSGDVAGLLANLLCLDGRLPTGSSASPIVSYYAFKEMFDQIEDICRANGLRMTCYVDDITVSGRGASRGVLNEVRMIISKSGLGAHKAKFFDTARPKEVTGVMVKGNSIDLPFSRWKAIRDSIRELESAETNEAKLGLYPSLISRLHEASQIDESCRPIALFHNEQWRQLRNAAG
uniref:reverse transcriptase family protein n=1 Tax=uncultured Altererythrobacter sp. TaxID=500840 RepID=UPI0026136E8A|nr:reverse transcriptase family protein [uncultured Altererythrobacter sp.]